MTRRVVFFPAEGNPSSPDTAIDEIADQEEKALLRLRLKMLSEREPHQWTMNWCKHYEGVYQVRTQHYRAIFLCEHTQLVVLDVFKKEGKKQARQDSKRRAQRLKAYQARLVAGSSIKK